MSPKTAPGSVLKKKITKITPKATAKTTSKPNSKTTAKITAKLSPQNSAKTSTKTSVKTNSKISPETSSAKTTAEITTISSPETTIKTITPEITPKTSTREISFETIPPESSAKTTTPPISSAKSTPVTNETSPETPAKTTANTVAKTAANTVAKTAAKTAAKKTIRVVKKVIKKKVVKRAQKVPEIPPSGELEKPELLVDKEKPSSSSSVPIEAEIPRQSDLSVAENPSSATAVPTEAPNVNSVRDQSDGDADGNRDSRNVGDKEVLAKEEVANCEVGDSKEEDGGIRDEEMEVSERRRRRKTEIFIGGLDKDAKEEDIRKVFEKIGEVVEVRLMMNNQTGKNKGYAFLRYAKAVDAKRALKEFSKVEVCGKESRAAPIEGNDTIFLGNIEKTWKKDDVLKLLQEIGIEKIDMVTVMSDRNNAECNRGFAFLELETNKDAQNAYKKLQKKGVFGKDQNIKVAWAEPVNELDEEETLKVKSVYVEGVPSSWDEEKVRKYFKKFGEIDRVVLARNIRSARRKDFAFVNYTAREAALACIESFSKEEWIDEGSKVGVKVSLAKPTSRGKQSKGSSKPISKNHSKEKPKTVHRNANISALANEGQTVKAAYVTSRDDKKSSRINEHVQVLREQAAWRQAWIGSRKGTANQDYTYSLSDGKRPFSALGDDVLYSDQRGYPRGRLDSFPIASSSYSALSKDVGAPLPYYQQPRAGYAAGSFYGAAESLSAMQMRQEVALYRSELYHRY